jgi:type IV pilus assembly protein PilE
MKNTISTGIRKHQKMILTAGFTLIELMIVVAVIGILATLSYPSYQCYVERSQRSSAVAVMLEGSQFMERYFTTNNQYAQDTSGQPVSATFPGPLLVSPREGTPRWNIALSNVTATTYTLNATPIVASACSPACGTLTIDQLQQRTAAGVTTPALVNQCFQR